MSPIDPRSQRRAATTLLRALDHKWPARSGFHGSSGSYASRAPRDRSLPPGRPLALPPLEPSITPDHAHSPQALATALAIDLREDFSDQAICTIESLLASNAPIADGDTLRERIHPLPSLSDQAQISDPTPFPQKCFAEGREIIITDAPTGVRLTLRFVRSHLGPWRLFDLNTS